MNPELRNRLIKATAGGAIALATVLIQWHEGVLYTPYRDSGGVLSVCYGHTGAVAISSPVSATSLLDSDQKAAMAIVDANVTAPLTENQKAALASFVYNVARGAFARSTLLKKLNAGDRAGACDEMRCWKYVDGKVSKGLVNWRSVEREFCLKPL
ncbi:Lysozyme RrrD [Sodalis glossinidius str. 'morsitans']|uniref:Lysozyme n=1 Tax=Sodalis glossinidius (strain morsitans) TaxID=343509 RepID=Q2NWV6_SODGM|nr:lysozyme [Sodalis glossinidius]BAE73369.1 phage lysozyme lysis protein [Sodalis glossinidius str. 'morsitans']CRL43696.1 Lysozyme RrrD [Sodalis glossinidius str. 'morsitans']